MEFLELFTDHAVLQRDMPIPVRGKAVPGKFVEIRLEPLQLRATSIVDADGLFLAWLPPQSAGGPYTLTATDEDGNCAVASDIYIGEVWWAGGQSNMEMPLAGFNKPLPDVDKLTFDVPVRMITIPCPTVFRMNAHQRAVWTLPQGEDLMHWSATAAYFAARLGHELQLPIGIVSVSRGGTIAETWTSRETLLRNSEMRAEVIAYEQRRSVPGYLDSCRVLLNLGEKDGWATPEMDDSNWHEMLLPRYWQDWPDMKFSGVVWFRRRMEIPESWVGRDLEISLGAIDKQDITYFNGQRVGGMGAGFESQYWNVPRRYRIPSELVTSRQIVIAVRVYSFAFAGGLLGPAEDMYFTPAEDTFDRLPLNGDWRYCIEHNLGIQNDYGTDLLNANHFYRLFNCMIAPLLPASCRGVIWYQGESNVANAGQYRRLICDLIADWRYHLGQLDMPFIQVLLAAYSRDPDSSWPLIRESQIAAAAANGTGYVNVMDTGDETDIHPLDKRTVGERLALSALAEVYGFELSCRGPAPESVCKKNGEIIVTFKYADGLHCVSGEPGGFELAGIDEVYFPAQAKIDGICAIVSSPEVPNPIYIRYGWRENPSDANLYNQANLPADPFRCSLNS